MWREVQKIVWKSHKKSELKPAIATMVVWNNHLVAGSYDGTIRTFSTEAKNKRTRVEHRYSIECLLVVDDELWSASSDFTISVWYFEEEKPLYILKGHTDVIDSIIRRDDKVLSASWDETIRIWDIKTKACIFSYKTSMSFVCELALHNGMLVAAGAQYIKVYTNNQFDSALTISKPHEDGVHFMCIWNEWIVSASGAHTNIKVWNMHGELLKVLPGHFYCIKSLCVIDGLLYSGSTGLILIWNSLESNPIEVRVSLENGAIRSFCMFDSKLFVGTHSGNILIYEPGEPSQTSTVTEVMDESKWDEIDDGKNEDDSSDQKSEKQDEPPKPKELGFIRIKRRPSLESPATVERMMKEQQNTKAKLRKKRKQTENPNFIPW